MRRRVSLVASLVAGVLAAEAFAAKPLLRLTAFAVDLSNVPLRTRAGTVDIAINRWSTPPDRDRLVAALREGGAEGLLKALQKADEVGYISSAGSLGYPLRFAWQMKAPDGGRRILIATDRRVSFLEAADQPRTIDYPFMLVDIRLGPEGKGEGKLMPLARIDVNDDHVVEIENYASEPVRLTEVHEIT